MLSLHTAPKFGVILVQNRRSIWSACKISSHLWTWLCAALTPALLTGYATAHYLVPFAEQAEVLCDFGWHLCQLPEGELVCVTPPSVLTTRASPNISSSSTATGTPSTSVSSCVIFACFSDRSWVVCVRLLNANHLCAYILLLREILMHHFLQPTLPNWAVRWGPRLQRWCSSQAVAESVAIMELKTSRGEARLSAEFN